MCKSGCYINEQCMNHVVYADDICTLAPSKDMLRQMRNLYISSNKLLRTFHYCSSDVKLELFKSYCTLFYCCYLWTAYKENQHSTGYVYLLITHTLVFSVSHGDAARVRCTLTLELITLKQLLENLHMVLCNGPLRA